MRNDDWRAASEAGFGPDEEPAPCRCSTPDACEHGPRERRERGGEELPFCPDCREPDGGHTKDCPSLKTDVDF